MLIKLQVLKTSLQNNSGTNEETLMEKYISPKLRQKNYWRCKIKIRLIKINIIYNNGIPKKIIILLDHTTNELSKFRTSDWVEINNESKGRYDNTNIRFKTTATRSSLCDYGDAYILVKGTILVPNTAAAGTGVNNTNKKSLFKNCAPFTDCIAEINNAQIDDAQKLMH